MKVGSGREGDGKEKEQLTGGGLGVVGKGGKGGKFGSGKSKKAPQSRSARAGLQVSRRGPRALFPLTC